MLNIKLSKKSKKFIEGIQPKHARQIKAKLLELMENPYPADVKKLIDYPFFRVDSGEYRIIYSVEKEILLIFLIGKRNDSEVYKQLKRIVR